MKINDVVMVNKDVEVSPLNFVKKATIGKVEDFTVPDFRILHGRRMIGHVKDVSPKHILRR